MIKKKANKPEEEQELRLALLRGQAGTEGA